MRYFAKLISLLSIPTLVLVTASPSLGNKSLNIAQTAVTEASQSEAYRLFQASRQQLDTGQLNEAVQSFEQALIINRNLGDRLSEGTALNSLGDTYTALGDYERAVDAHQQALAIAIETGNRQREYFSANKLGENYAALGEDDSSPCKPTI